MAFGEERFDFETAEDRVVITGIEDFDYTDQEFSFWRSDCYGNNYLSDDSYFRVVPSHPDQFPQLMKHHLAYLVNLSALENYSVEVPEFEIGIIREDDDVFPYSVLEKPDGRPLSEIPEVLEEDDWRKKFGELNDKGKTLSDMNRILYPIERRNEDVLINPERDEMTYINPGTFNQEALFNQFSKSDEVPSNRMVLADWLSESFWKQKMM